MDDPFDPCQLRLPVLTSSSGFSVAKHTSDDNETIFSRDFVNQDSKERLILHTYCEVEAEFFTWEQQMCAEAIGCLLRDTSVLSSLLNESAPSSTADAYNLSRAAHESPGVDKSIVTYYTSGCRKSVMNIARSTLTPKLQRSPTYEACTPSTINLGARLNQVLDDKTLTFIPYVDDETFDLQAYIDFFDTFGWMSNAELDPDLEQIQFETARRLLANHNIDINTVDIDPSGNSKYLCFLRKDEYRRFLKRYTQRDLLPWSMDRLESKVDAGSIHKIKNYQLRISDFKRNLESHSDEFCANLNCLGVHCRTHNQNMPSPFALESKLASDELLHKIKRPCGEECTKIIVSLEEVIWDEYTIDLLEEILRRCPNVLPCELAQIVRKPCYQVFAQRQRLIPDEEVSLGMRQPPQENEPNPVRVPGKRSHLVAGPCNHPGPCGEDQNCECRNEQVYCQRSCWCGPSCSRRWKGCNSTCFGESKRLCVIGRGRKSKERDACLCVKAYRECDPELCTNCGSAKCEMKVCNEKYISLLNAFEAHDAQKSSCMNSAIQHGRTKCIAIERAEYGYGGFLVEPVSGKHVLLGEYVGQIIGPEDNISSLDFLQNYRKRNYAFTVGDLSHDGYTLDAFSISNEIRFPNHCKENAKRQTCYAREILVNGEHRVALFSYRRVRAGKELLFPYGESFFVHDVEPDT